MGGSGGDAFYFLGLNDFTPVNGAVDRILDMWYNDYISLGELDANVDSSGNQDFTIVDAFSGYAGELRVNMIASSESDGGLWNVSGDVNGDRQADFTFQVTTIPGINLDLTQEYYWDL